MWKYDETTAWSFYILEIPHTIFWFSRFEYSSFSRHPQTPTCGKSLESDLMKHIYFRVCHKWSCREHVIFLFLDTAQNSNFMKYVDLPCLSRSHWLSGEDFVVFDIVITRFWWNTSASRVYQNVTFVVLRIYDLLMLTQRDGAGKC